jgi:hypothetical protein
MFRLRNPNKPLTAEIRSTRNDFYKIFLLVTGGVSKVGQWVVYELLEGEKIKVTPMANHLSS